jgi:hypothetical protein
MFHKENQIFKQSKSSSPKSQYSIKINAIASNEHKQRSGSFSNGIDQIVGFIQRKFSRINDEEIQEFDDLKKIK